MDCVQDGRPRKCWRFISHPLHSKHTLCKYNKRHRFPSFLFLNRYLSSKAGQNLPGSRNNEGNQSYNIERAAHGNAGIPRIGVLMSPWGQRLRLRPQEEQRWNPEIWLLKLSPMCKAGSWERTVSPGHRRQRGKQSIHRPWDAVWKKSRQEIRIPRVTRVWAWSQTKPLGQKPALNKMVRNLSSL